MSPRALLRDPALDRQLLEHGWVVVDLLSPLQVRALRRRYRRLPHDITTDRSFAAGFHATIIDDRTEYRERVHEVIADAVGPRVQELFDSVQLTLTNFVVKAPGADRVPNHVDWTFVDEAVHRSASIWSPLSDTGPATGAIGVLDGSHRRVDFVRAAANPTYQETDAFGAELPGRTLVPLRAGEAVVFDHRLVHFSAPHGGRRDRVAVTFELVPAEADVLHFEQLGPGRFRRHTVRPEFFVRYAAGQDPCDVPGHLACEEVDAVSFNADGAAGSAAPTEAT
jgi:hypothetical protein